MLSQAEMFKILGVESRIRIIDLLKKICDKLEIDADVQEANK